MCTFQGYFVAISFPSCLCLAPLSPVSLLLFSSAFYHALCSMEQPAWFLLLLERMYPLTLVGPI